MQYKLTIPKKGPFKWLSKQYKVSWDSPETHYIAFAWGKLEVNIGSYVIAEKPKTPATAKKKYKQCLVAKVLELFDDGDGGSLETAYARVIWFSNTENIPTELKQQLADTGSTYRELVEDTQPLDASRVPISSFVCKCFVLLLDNTVSGSTVWETYYNGLPLFYCRWRFDGNSLQPLERSDPPIPPPPPPPAPRGRGRPRLYPPSTPRPPNPSPTKVLDPFCPQCNTTFHNFHMLGDHIGQVHHTGDGPFACPYCPDFICYTMAKLKNHLRNHSRSNFQCNVCKKHFKNIGHLRTHAVLHTETQKNKVIKCPYCHFSSDKLIPLKRHMIIAHKGKFPYTCSDCHKGFVLPSHLLRHKELCSAGISGDDLESGEVSEDSSIQEGHSTSEVPHVELSMDQLNEISSKIQESEQPSTSGIVVKASTSTAASGKGIFTMSQQAQETLASVLEEVNEASTSQISEAPTTQLPPLVEQASEQPVQETSSFVLEATVQQEPPPEQVMAVEQAVAIQENDQIIMSETTIEAPSQDKPMSEAPLEEVSTENAVENKEVPITTITIGAEQATAAVSHEMTPEEAVSQEVTDQEMADVSEMEPQPQEPADQEIMEAAESEHQVTTTTQDAEATEAAKEGEEEAAAASNTTAAGQEEPMEVSTEGEQREMIYFETGEEGGGEDQPQQSGGDTRGDIHKLLLEGSELTAIESGDGQLIINSSQLALQAGEGEDNVIYLTQDELYTGPEGTQFIIIPPEMLQEQDDSGNPVLVYNPPANPPTTTSSSQPDN